MDCKNSKKGVSHMLPAESRTVWKKLREMAESGDMKAIKLYYDILEKKKQNGAASGIGGDDTSGGKPTPEMMRLSEIRRAVFGDSVIDGDYLRLSMQESADAGGEIVPNIMASGAADAEGKSSADTASADSDEWAEDDFEDTDDGT